MSKQKFSLPQAQATQDESSTSTAGDMLRKLDAQKSFNFMVIPYIQLRPSPDNQFHAEKIPQIKESIKERGLFHNFVVIRKENYYEILSGNTRYIAIGELLQEGDTQFTAGIPCRVIEPGTDRLECKIIIEEANVDVRDDTEEFRKAIARLEALYKERNDKLGVNTSITKQVAAAAGIKERQVQRYNSVNNKLIPELQERFDNGAFNLENAASFAAMPEESQKLILSLLNQSEKNSQEEISFAKKQAKEFEKKYQQQIEMISQNSEKQKFELENLLKNLKEKEVEIQEKEAELQAALETKPEESATELVALETKIQQLQKEKEEAVVKQKKTEEELKAKIKKEQEELEALKKVKTEEAEKLQATSVLDEESKKKAKESFELDTIYSTIVRNLSLLEVKVEAFKKSYKAQPEIDIRLFNQKLERLKNLLK